MDIASSGRAVDGHCQQWEGSGWTLPAVGGQWMDIASSGRAVDGHCQQWEGSGWTFSWPAVGGQWMDIHISWSAVGGQWMDIQLVSGGRAVDGHSVGQRWEGMDGHSYQLVSSGSTVKNRVFKNTPTRVFQHRSRGVGV